MPRERLRQSFMERTIPMEHIQHPDRHPRKCTATSKRSKQLYEKWAMKAQRVCSFHGGKAPRALANAQAAIERADLQLRGLTVPAVDARKRFLSADSESVILGALTEFQRGADLDHTRRGARLRD